MKKKRELSYPEITRGMHQAEADMAFHLELFGDWLAQRQKYRGGLRGIEVVRYYLMQKHGWLPRDVNSMSYLELRFAVTEEKAGWTVSEATLQELGKSMKRRGA